MAKKEKEPDVRTDAAGRELNAWEVDPAEQVVNPIAEEGGEVEETAPKTDKPQN